MGEFQQNDESCLLAEILRQVGHFSTPQDVKFICFTDYQISVVIVILMVVILMVEVIVMFQKMLAHPSEECGVGAVERGGDNPLGKFR